MAIIKILGSLAFAVFLIGALALVLMVSTSLESAYGTPLAQKFIYEAGWFDVFLALLAVNIVCSTIARWPFKKRHTGFIITHIGILLLLAGSFLSRRLGVEGQMALYEGESGREILQKTYELFVHSHDGSLARFPLMSYSGDRERRWDVFGSRFQVAVGRVWENAAETTDLSEGPADSPANPAIGFTLKSDLAGFEEPLWLVEKNPWDSSSQRLSVGPAVIELGGEKELPPPRPGAASLIFHPGNPRWTYAASTSKASLGGEIEAGKAYPAGWMDFSFSVRALFDRAVVSKRVRRALGTEKGRLGAQVSLAQDGKPLFKDWILEDNAREVLTPDGAVILAVRLKRAKIPFSLALKDFRKIDYPGTDRPASYESDVVLHDPRENLTLEKTIRMNKPLDYRGYRVFQSSYAQDPVAGEASVFTIAKNPGVWLIYSGAVILFTGIGLVFFVKPFSSMKN